ncbi:MAG: glycosidase [Chitinophagaceae bacterium]|nr:glycosidase [Chitinophagaceae bacterium]
MRILFLAVCLAIFSCHDGNNEPSVTAASPATSPDLSAFRKIDSLNPVLIPDSGQVFQSPILGKQVKWEEKDVFNPAAIVRNDTVFMLYRAEDKIGKYAGTSRIGLAWSLDGLHFTKHPVPVFYPDNDAQKHLEWEGGCEDPRIVADSSGMYVMTYTAYDGDKARMLIATSRDLYHWTKHGSAFAKTLNGKYAAPWSKSGSIVSTYPEGSPVAQRVNGKYWMYWGDTDIFLATSEDLINWTPVESTEGKLVTVFGPRAGMFDSDLVEPGPPAMIEEKGIRLIYNSRNVRSKGDTSLAEGTYAAGYVLFDKNDPAKILERSTNYFMKPDRPYEINGQVNHVCFLEGLVRYKGHWYLYYGTADSRIAVAVN